MQTQTAPLVRSLQLSPSAALLTVLLAVIFFGSIRYRLRDMPLERDEGEYAYSGQLLLQGIPPYKLAYNMKLPGIYLAYAATMAAFGETPSALHLGLLLVNAITVFLLYFLTSTLFGRLAALVAACTYALLSTSTSVMGFEAHATNFVVLPALASIFLLLLALRSEHPSRNSGVPPAVEQTSHSLSLWLLFSSGLLSGIGFLMKQHGAFFALFCLFYLLWTDWKKKTPRMILGDVAILASGTLLPYLVSCCLLYRAGVFSQFWFWTVSYANEYSKVGTHRAIRAFLDNSRTVVTPALPLWLLAAVGLSAVFWSQSARRNSVFICGFVLFSFLSLCPGAYFRPHYFVLLLPAIAILAGIAVSAASESLARPSSPAYLVIIPALIFVGSFFYAVVHQRLLYFHMNPAEVVQATYDNNAFVPAVEVARYIKNNSPETARIAVLGSEPEIYFYAQRHSATGYIYMYSLIGRQKYTTRMRAEFMRELEQNQPDYLVYVDVWDSWGDRNGDSQLAGFLAGLQEYMSKAYDRVGVADIGSDTRYIWGDAATTYVPVSSKVIYVLKRRESKQSQDAFLAPFKRP